MKTTVLFILAFASSLLSHAQPYSRKDFQRLESLLGTWKTQTSKGTLYESWRKLNDSTSIGKSYKIAGKDTIVFEQVELVRRNGKIMYMPVVANENRGKRVAFTLTTLKKGVYTFENKEHDFPQRVVYDISKVGEKLLHAWIEGDDKGKPRRVDYVYSRAL